MSDMAGSLSFREDQALRAEIVRLNKIIRSLMNRAERDLNGAGSNFGLFQTTIMLEDEVRNRTRALEAALRENEKINRALQHTKERMEREIEERKQLEEQLRQRERYQRAVLDNFPFLVWLKDAQSRFLAVNRPFVCACGQASAEALIGKSDFDVWPRDRAERYRAEDRAVLASGEAASAEESIDEGGERIWLETYKSPVSLDGRVIGTVGFARNITAARQTQAALRKERDRNQRYLDTVQTIMVALDAEGRIRMINRKGCGLLGYEERELLGRNWFDTCLPQPAGMDEIYPVFRRIMDGDLQAVEYLENAVLCRDGSQRLIAWHNAYLTAEDGRIVGTLSSGEDITVRKQAEEALRKSEATYRSLFENMLNGFAYCRMLFEDGRPQDFVYLGVNDAFETLTGLKDVVGRKVSEVIPGIRESDSELLEIYGRVAMSGEPERFEMFVEALQMWFWISVYSPQREHFVAVFDVITERKRAEQALRESETRHRAVLAALGEGVYGVDREGRCTFINPTALALLDFAEDEVLGKVQHALFHHHRSDGEPYLRAECPIHQTAHDGQVRRGEEWFFRKDGTGFPVEMVATPLTGAGGERVGAVVAFQDIRERNAAHERIVHLANYDELTGLPNRNLLRDRLQQSLNYAERFNSLVEVLFLDLDHFKLINDTLGHDVGDELLKVAGSRISACVRETDTVARLGGDEFVVVVPGGSQDEGGGRVLARRILEAFRQPVLLTGRECFITCSIGAARFPRDGYDVDTLLKHADAAMYRAKDLGRDAFEFYTPAASAEAYERLHLESALRHGIERREFLLHYQPQVDLCSGRIVGLEALIRWQHPELGMVSPARFIPLAEQTGQILPIGEWVLRTACAQAKAWQEAGYPPLRIAVNLSARQFRQPDLAQKIQDILREVALDPQHLELELTESMLMHHEESTVALMAQLKDLGLRLSLDDFGTGYSSLSYLKRFPIDNIKIDRSFVQEITSDPDSAAIADAVIAMAHSMSLTVIAEGVESDGQLAALRSRGCDQIQGFHFSRPLPPEEVAQMLREGRSLTQPTRPTDDQNSRTLLLVDDEPAILRALDRLLRRDGYRILTATSAASAFELLATHDVRVIVSDQRMPGMNGAEFLERANHLYPQTVRIMLTGYTDLESLTNAVNRGAIFKFLTKPWSDCALRQSVREAFRRHSGFIPPMPEH